MRTTEIKWDPTQEAQWNSNNEGRLDIMAIRIDLNSSQLVTAEELSRYKFLLPAKGQIELLFEDLSLESGEEIFLEDISSGKVIFSI
ncbi:MAG: hypothetical protein M3R25_00120, partial [Bacteroidota bacterium]|nr:hypothetical protein [Bacteroidota bacterium]